MENTIICNCCGKEIAVKNEVPQEDFLHIKKQWGYFSKKDGSLQEMYACEDCFENWTKQFRIPINNTETTEYM